ncbi:MAG: VanZ family protein [Candidatus Nomurabacteria bacterium]|jgi:glycopeptide antibiotics resistance protein|nr:VanZ family protein [Candidatus Nomurabacteria bacterium]
MWDFISNFSNSFLFAVFLWPFMALFLTLPVLLVQYIRFHKVYVRRMVVIYLLFLYVLALFAFTLYPLPDDPEAFCVGKHLSPQLNPIQFLFDIKEEGVKATLQIIANVVFFVPLGVFLRNLFGKKLLVTVFVALLTALLIETAQLTGAFGIFPCSYRLFDVNDLMFNTLGAMIGFGLAGFLPNFSKLKKREGVNTNPGIIQRMVVFVADCLLGGVLALIIISPAYFLGMAWREWWLVTQISCFVIMQFVVPLFFGGKTVFGGLTGVSLDDKNRGWPNRLLFYGLRAGILGCMMFYDGSVAGILTITMVVSWAIFRKMPYKIVDIFFHRK